MWKEWVEELPLSQTHPITLLNIFIIVFKFMYDNGHIYKILEDYNQNVPSYIGTSIVLINNNTNNINNNT